MHEDAIKARAPDAGHEHNNSEHEQSTQKTGALGKFSAVHICGVFFASAFQLGARAWSTRRRSAMQRRGAGCNHSLRGFGLVFARRHVGKNTFEILLKSFTRNAC